MRKILPATFTMMKYEKLIWEVKNNFPLTRRPFLKIAKRLGMKEKEVINALKEIKEKGGVKRIGIVKEQKAYLVGIKGNVGKLTKKLIMKPEVTHIIEREGSEFNLWIVIRADDPKSWLQKMRLEGIALESEKVFKT